jgi:hypothetical protein
MKVLKLFLDFFGIVNLITTFVLSVKVADVLNCFIMKMTGISFTKLAQVLNYIGGSEDLHSRPVIGYSSLMKDGIIHYVLEVGYPLETYVNTPKTDINPDESPINPQYVYNVYEINGFFYELTDFPWFVLQHGTDVDGFTCQANAVPFLERASAEAWQEKQASDSEGLSYTLCSTAGLAGYRREYPDLYLRSPLFDFQ